jgi:hypothetical protein
MKAYSAWNSIRKGPALMGFQCGLDTWKQISEFQKGKKIWDTNYTNRLMSTIVASRAFFL